VTSGLTAMGAGAIRATVARREVSAEEVVRAHLDRITALVRAGRCECEVKNPQGSCCLGNLAAIAKSATAALAAEASPPATVRTCAE